MSHFGAHVHSDRTIFAFNVDKNKVLQQMNAKKWTGYIGFVKASLCYSR